MIVVVILVTCTLMLRGRNRTAGSRASIEDNDRRIMSSQESSRGRAASAFNALHPVSNGRDISTSGTNSNASDAALVLQELRGFDDPAAEQLTDVLDQAGWPKREQLQRFKETYDQLVRIHQLNDLIADNRVNMRSQFESIETNELYSAQMRRESRRQYMILQNTFEATLHQRQAETMTNLLRFLGPAPGMDSDELRRQLLDVHPRFPIEGPITNFLPQIGPPA